MIENGIKLVSRLGQLHEELFAHLMGTGMGGRAKLLVAAGVDGGLADSAQHTTGLKLLK